MPEGRVTGRPWVPWGRCFELWIDLVSKCRVVSTDSMGWVEELYIFVIVSKVMVAVITILYWVELECWRGIRQQ